jgi:hypothetical protein
MPSPQPPAWYDEERADEAVLALLWLGTGLLNPETARTRSRFPDDILARLHDRGYISRNPATDLVTFTELGATHAAEAFRRLFGKPNPATIIPPHESHVVEEIDGD